MRTFVRGSLLVALLAFPARVASAAELAGSPASMVHQHAIAVEEDYSFLRTPADIERFVAAGRLVPVTPTADYTLSGVSYPYTRPEVLSFIEHFAASYRAATGSRLVVTSLTRPEAKQPANAHVLSVHPAGMAVDLRVPTDAADRSFLERSLLSMERAGLLDVTREHHPSHYHIAVFAPKFEPYAALLDSVTAVERSTRLARHRADSIAHSAIAAATGTEQGGSRLPAALLGMIAIAGVTAPAVRHLRRHRKNSPLE
jgi:hypothetical protein